MTNKTALSNDEDEVVVLPELLAQELSPWIVVRADDKRITCQNAIVNLIAEKHLAAPDLSVVFTTKRRPRSGYLHVKKLITRFAVTKSR